MAFYPLHRAAFALLALLGFSVGLCGETQPAANEPAGAMTGLYKSAVQIVSRFSTHDFTPDGNVSKRIWSDADWVQFSRDMSGRQDYPQALTRAASVWTAREVYFAFWCRYSSLNVYSGEDPIRERWELWNRDVVEVFLNPAPERLNHYYEFEVAPNNQWIDLEIDKLKTPFNDPSWDSHFEHATRIDAVNHVWTCEMRIPVAALGVSELVPGAEWRLNLFRADGQGDDQHRRLMSWSSIPEGNTFHVPARFGLIRFAEQ